MATRSKYKIGVDARLLAEPITGIGRYTYEVLSRLVHMGHEWVLYSHKPLTIGDWSLVNVKIRSLNISGRTARMLWAQSILPLWAKADHVDVFWSPAHRIPKFLDSEISSVVTIHDLVWKHAPETMRPLSRFLDSRLMPAAIRRANKVIAVSEHTKCDLLNEVPSALGKTSTIYLGVDFKVHSGPTPIFKIASDAPEFFLFVGTLEPRKNLERLLQAFAIIPSQIRQDIKLFIVGGKGWGGINLNSLLRKFGLQDSVKIFGYVSDEQLGELYSRAMFLAMPSLYEGFGLPLVEAMACGTPVLSSNLSSMVEVVGGAGVLVDPWSVESISVGLVRLLGDSELRRGLSIQGVIRSKFFNWDNTARKTMEVLIQASDLRASKSQ